MDALKFCLLIIQPLTKQTKFYKLINIAVYKKGSFRQYVSINKYPILFLWSVPFLSTDSYTAKSAEFKPRLVNQRKEIKKAILKADELFESNKYDEAILELLQFKYKKPTQVIDMENEVLEEIRNVPCANDDQQCKPS